MLRKELFIRFTVRVFRGRLSNFAPAIEVFSKISKREFAFFDDFLFETDRWKSPFI